MIIKRPPAEKSGLDLAIDEVLREMQGFTAETDEYAKMTTQLEKLYNLKEIDCPERVSRDTIVIVIGNLLGIAMIIGYERTNVITSKALTFIREVRR